MRESMYGATVRVSVTDAVICPPTLSFLFSVPFSLLCLCKGYFENSHLHLLFL